MKRNVIIAMFVVLMLAYVLPAHGGNKETIELQEEVKMLGTRMASMQQSFDERMAALQANTEQTANNVKQISAWAAHVDATLKQQTADSDTCADQLSGNSKALHEQLEDLRTKLDAVVKQLHELNAASRGNSASAPLPETGANSSAGKETRPSDTSQP